MSVGKLRLNVNTIFDTSTSNLSLNLIKADIVSAASFNPSLKYCSLVFVLASSAIICHLRASPELLDLNTSSLKSIDLVTV